MANTPQDLYLEYRNLDVLLVDGRTIFGIDVHEYRNYSKTGDIGCAAGIEAYNKLKEKIEKYGEKIGRDCFKITYPIADYPKTLNPKINGENVTLMFPLWRVFIGKGSPAFIQQALRLAVAFGLIEDTKAAMQNYCDNNIGLDCSGFAGNYLGGDWMSQKSSDFAATKLTNLSDVQSGTAIVWQSGVHVALVDMVVNTEKAPDGKISSITCGVAESTADRMFTDGVNDGLNYSEYTITGSNPQSGSFSIKRPIVYKSKDSSHTVSVYLGNNAKQSLAEPYIF